MTTPKNFNHLQWLNDYDAALQGNHYGAIKELRAAIFQGTITYVRESAYAVNSRQVKIDNDCITTEYFRKPDRLTTQGSFNTTFSVINADCLEAAIVLLDCGLHPCVLNMASRQNPGGGVLNGAGAQEENLFRRTNLFVSLYQFAPYAADYGIARSKDSYPFDRNTGGIYSRNITVFRGSEKNGYCLLQQPYKTSFVSVPALNHPELVKKNGLYYIADALVEPTKEKIRTILRISGKYRHDSLVLGAFGCGAFANPPNHMAQLFKEVFCEDEFNGVFKSVVFAIFDDHNSRKEHNPYGNCLPFQEVFDA
jgi:uncharacterized protein (TIGR02452 family)